MRISYNQIAGQSIERLAALSDGIFAVVMTLLVLDLHAPAREAVGSSSDLAAALGRLRPSIAAYLMSYARRAGLLTAEVGDAAFPREPAGTSSGPSWTYGV